MIYMYPLGGRSFYFQSQIGLSRPRVIVYQDGVRVHRVLALTTACRQTHAEAATVLFSEGRFGSNDHNDFKALEEGIKHFAPFQRDAIRCAWVSICCFQCHFTHLPDLGELLPKLSGLKEFTIKAYGDKHLAAEI